MPRAPGAPLLILLALAACTAPRLSEPPPGAPGTNPALVAACRAEVAAQLSRQDRGMLLREEERQSRLGSETTGGTAFRAPMDRMGREFRFEQLVQDCVRRNSQPAAPREP